MAFVIRQHGKRFVGVSNVPDVEQRGWRPYRWVVDPELAEIFSTQAKAAAFATLELLHDQFEIIPLLPRAPRPPDGGGTPIAMGAIGEFNKASLKGLAFSMRKLSMERVTEISLGGRNVVILGDPHLGRAFVSGVPLARRGEREASVMADFKASLQLDEDVSYHVCMGDLFDKWFVPYGIVWEAATTYITAARARPDVLFIVLGGNHDVSKDLEKKGALDLFELATAALPNVQVVRHKAYYTEIGTAMCGFFPWHPTLAADELVTKGLDVAFGHWDTIFGHDNMIPTEKLELMGCTLAYTGHVHLPDEFTRNYVQVVQVGSMQPYAHGEDDGEMYVTVTSDQLAGKDLSKKCVRVQLRPGEIFDAEVDALQLTFKRADSAAEDEVEVSLGDFNMHRLFEQAFAEEAVPEAISAAIISRFEEARVRE